MRLLTHRQLLFTTHTQEVLSLSRYSHRGGALPFLGYSGLDISFASSISQAMYGCRPAVMVATPLFMASRNHTALSCLLLNTYYSHTGSYYLLLTHRQLLTTYYLPLSHRHGCWESGEEARTKRGDRATTRAEIGGGPSAQKAFRE